MMVVMAWLLLFRLESDPPPTRPLPPPVVVPTPPPTPASPRPGEQSPTPSQGGTERRTTLPGQDNDIGGDI
ncbi:hypothetical protein [Microtetraspora malaysiensis]|uniref:hypothetical protein n=1 Tax=Microtetraspora malaysiensis TaxID=161358 RepID=UPI003D92DEC2